MDVLMLRLLNYWNVDGLGVYWTVCKHNSLVIRIIDFFDKGQVKVLFEKE